MRANSPNLLERYVRAWEAADVAGLVALLREDAVLIMPPRPTVVGATQIGEFLARSIFPMETRLIGTRSNLGLAFVAFTHEPIHDQVVPFALLVIDGDGRSITHIHAYAGARDLARFDLSAGLAG